jgi:hypothetical protein
MNAPNLRVDRGRHLLEDLGLGALDVAMDEIDVLERFEGSERIIA